MRTIKRLLLLLLTLAVVATPLCSCEQISNLFPSETEATSNTYTVQIDGPKAITMEKGDTLQLYLKSPERIEGPVTWSASSISATVDSNGLVTANYVGEVQITVTHNGAQDSVTITVIRPVETTPDIPDDSNNDEDYDAKYASISREDFYADYEPAENAEDAYYRSKYGLMSGSLTVPDQAPVMAENRPMQDGKYIRNATTGFVGNDVYILVDFSGGVVMEIYRGGAYITLEEVAAYVYAFGDVPANYVNYKNASPASSIWGEYLRVNNTYFSGDTRRYPYEPELPNIDGCGGELAYYEIDIGTTGTDCDPKYAAELYNNGYRITRGAARIVYARYDKNGDTIIDPNERYLFYTYNHYNDFQEYLNYYGGWGEMFGNITGGGTISSKYDYNPTPYVESILAPLVIVTPLPGVEVACAEKQNAEIIYFFCPVIDKCKQAA